MGFHPGMDSSEAGALPFEFKMSTSTLMEGFDEPESLHAPMDLPMNLDKIGSDLLSKPYDISDNANAQLNDLLDNIKASLNSPMPSAYSANTAFPGGLYTDPVFQSTTANPIPPSFMSDAKPAMTAPPPPADNTTPPTSFQPSEQTMFADIAKPGTLFQNIPQMAPSDPLLQNSFPTTLRLLLRRLSMKWLSTNCPRSRTWLPRRCLVKSSRRKLRTLRR